MLCPAASLWHCAMYLLHTSCYLLWYYFNVLPDIRGGHRCSYAMSPGNFGKLTPVPFKSVGLHIGAPKILCRRHGLCAQQLHDYDRGVSCDFDGDGLLRIECSIGDCVGRLRLLPKKNEGISSNMFAVSSSGGLLRFTLDLFAGPLQKAAARQGGVSASSHSFLFGVRGH